MTAPLRPDSEKAPLRQDGTKAPLRLVGLHLAVGDHVLIEQLDAEVEPGTCLVVMGASGSGKSSLLAYLAGTLDAAFQARGRVLIGDSDLTALAPEHRRLGLLFQDDLLFPHLSVLGNLLFALPAGERSARVHAAETALVEAGLAGFGQRLPSSLSGGQRSRVSLLRALLAAPRALLLDEPFSKLDATLREQMRQFTFATLMQRRVPALLVTHDEADVPAGAQVIRLANA